MEKLILDLTKSQLDNGNVISFIICWGKPAYDLLICDKQRIEEIKIMRKIKLGKKKLHRNLQLM